MTQPDSASAPVLRDPAPLLERVRAQSDIISPVEPAPGDRVLTLCTWTSKPHDLRYVVCAKLIPLA